MRRWKGSRLLRMGMLSIIVFLGLPVIVSAQRRGWDRGQHYEGSSKKCDKFVNCHDARDGRWDGRGPHRNWDDTGYRRYRHRRHSDDDDFYWRRNRERYEESFYRMRERQRYRYNNYYRNDYYRDGSGTGFNLSNLLQILNP